MKTIDDMRGRASNGASHHAGAMHGVAMGAIGSASLLLCGFAYAQVTPTTLTSANQSYTVPANVHFVQVQVSGAGGGGGGADAGSSFGADGGSGAQVAATIAVAPGDTGTLLTLGVGGTWGHSRNTGTNYSDGGIGGPGFGNGGGGATSANPPRGTGYSGAGGGGGGGTTFSMNNVVIHAGGGGGGGGGSYNSYVTPNTPPAAFPGNAGSTGSLVSDAQCTQPSAFENGLAGISPYQPIPLPADSSLYADGGGGGGGGGGFKAGNGGIGGSDNGQRRYDSNGAYVNKTGVPAQGGSPGGSCYFASGSALVGTPVIQNGVAGGRGSKGTVGSVGADGTYNPSGANAATRGANGRVLITPLPSLTVQKAWGAGFNAGDAVQINVTSLPGGATTANSIPLNSTASAAVSTTGPLVQAVGNVITFNAETFTTENPAHYAQILACTNNGVARPVQADPTSGGFPYTLQLADTDNDVVCTYSNTPVPILGISKANNGPWRGGQANAVFTLSVSNAGLVPTSSAVTVLDTLPTGITAASGSYGGWACSVTGQDVSCTTSNPVPTTGANFDLPVTVSNAATSTSVTNYASVGGGGDIVVPVAPAPGAACAPASHCASSSATVNPTVTPGTSLATVPAGTPSTPVNVITTATINGQPVSLDPTSGNATITGVSSSQPGITLNPLSGQVSVTGDVPPGGPYTVSYSLCDKLGQNCVNATATITVTATILPVADSATVTAGVDSTAITNVVSNGDTVNGKPAVLGASGNATVKQDPNSAAWPTGIVLDPTTGAVTVSKDVPPGTHNLKYQLCDKSSPVNCSEAAITLTVNANIAPVADSATVTAGVDSTAIANVVSNGDMVNGKAAVLGASGNATVKPDPNSAAWPTGIALDPNTGAVTVSKDVAPGTYNLKYQLCDKSTPVNCNEAAITVTVNADIAPVADTATVSAGVDSTAIANVAGNDVVNGKPAVLGASGNATVKQDPNSPAWPTGIALDPATGAVSVSKDVEPGIYNLKYQLCDKSSPVNCKEASITLTVSSDVAPVADTATVSAGVDSTAITNVASNDVVNGKPAVLGASGNATVKQDPNGPAWPTGISLDETTGAVKVTKDVAPGTYNLKYQLCDKSSPAVCKEASITLTVNADVAPVADTATVTAGVDSTAIANVASNDTVNGKPAVLGASGNATVKQDPNSPAWPTGISLDETTGAVKVSKDVAQGTYNLQYQLCDKSSPAVCKQATLTITVGTAVTATPVPTLGQWSLMLLASIMAGFGMLRSRRQSRK